VPSLIYDIVYGVAMILGIVAGFVIYLCWDAVTAKHGRIAPHEQLRERTPWPPPPLPQDTGWVTVSYDRPQREPLALPRGDR
jgi:hypothetical protein